MYAIRSYYGTTRAFPWNEAGKLAAAVTQGKGARARSWLNEARAVKHATPKERPQAASDECTSPIYAAQHGGVTVPLRTSSHNAAEGEGAASSS